MANNIVLHRRGTAEEWEAFEELDQAPLDGELVIEICSDGSRRGKLGDGSTPFSKLPYIDETLQNELLAEIGEVKSEVAASFDAKLALTKRELLQAIEDKSSSIISACATSDRKVVKALQGQLTNALKTTEDLEKSVSSLETTVSGMNSLKTEISTLDKKFNNSIKELATQEELSSSAAEWLANLNSLKTELEQADDTLSDLINRSISEGEVFSDDVLNQLSSLNSTVAPLREIDLSSISTLRNLANRNEDRLDQLDRLVDEQTQKHSADFAKIIAEISRVEEAQKSADLADSEILIEQITKIYVEIADLVDDDITILKRLFLLEAKIDEEIKGADKKVTEKLNEFKQILGTSLDTPVDEAITALRNGLAEIKQSLTTTTDNLNTLDRKVNRLEQTTINNKDALDQKITSTNERITNLDSLINNRISNLITEESVNIQENTELKDIRNSVDGIVYKVAGDYVRNIDTNVKNLRESLTDYIGTQAVDGLYYDSNGDVGLKQQYMLYLTAGGEVIENSGVQIVSGAPGGGGGSGASSLKIGYITESPLVVTPSNKALIYFTFSGTDSSGDIIRQAKATWKVDGVTAEYGTVKNGENEFDATKYVKTGTTTLLLIVTDDNGSVVTKTWNIQLIDLSLESAFNEKRKNNIGESVIFDYTPNGAVDKNIIFKLDGKDFDTVSLGKDISGSSVSYEIPAQSHGSHLLEVYIEADINGETVPSNHIFKDIIWYDPNAEAAVISASVQNITAKQYSTTNIVYTVYDPKSETPTVNIEVDGVVVSSPTIYPNKDYDNTPTAVYSYVPTVAGSHTIKLVCGNTKKVISAYVEDIGISIAPVTTGLAFDFNPVGRSNGDANRLWSHNGVSMTVSENFDWINGGYLPDEVDGPCFCIKAGSSVTIDYKLFSNEAKTSGKEFKFVFKTKNVSNPDAIFLSCIDNTTAKDHVGITMGVHEARIYGKNGNLDLAYSENDAVEFEFNISKDTEAVPMVMGYEDGVPSRPMVYDSSYSFKQNTPKEITLGSPDCDLYIYRFKVYNTSLSNSNILKNFIADARTAEEMISRHNRNQIYDENNRLTAETLAEKCPWLRVYKVSAPHFTNSKSDKVANTTIQQIYHGGDPVLDNWIAYNAQHSGQGTSSNNYGAAGRNLDFIMNKSGAYFELGDGTTASEITLTRNSVPVAYLNAKVNIASSNNLTNAIIANRYNQFNPYKRPFVRDEGYNIDSIKDTMEFHNCVIFIQETDTNLSTHREFADTDWHFYAIGNIGDSKKTDKTRLTDKSDPYECCVEIMDVGLPLSGFPRDTMIDAMSYSIDEKTGERVYAWATDDNLDKLHEKIDGEYVLTSDTTVNLEKTYYVDILEHDDFSEDYTYGWRYLSDEDDSDVVNTCKQAWIDFYRFVTTASDEEFKANLKDYFIVDSALYYYLFTTRYCMVDNRAKNTFWHYGKAADGTRKWDLCWDYDNDTSLGLNNFGKQVYRYGLEDIDFDDAGEEVFRQSDSLFFCRIRDLFGAELKKMYQDLESKNAWNSSTFIAECDAWQDEFPEELWRVDIDRKYIRTYNKSFINGKGDPQFLTNMANGKMKYHRRQWERSQEQYMASKYQTTTSLGDDYHANFRVNRFDSSVVENLVIKPSYQFTLTPYSYMYLNVEYGKTTPISVRAKPNEPTVVPYSGTSADIINVGSAANIRDFGDLSALYPDTVSVQNASRIRTLKIGNSTSGYANAGFTSLATGSNDLLEELDITNITSYDDTLDLKKLINLRKLYASGTQIPSVLFAEGGKIDYVELPAINALTLNNLNYLTTDNINISSYDNLVDLIITNCSLIDQLTLFETCTALTKVKLDNINFGTKTYEYFENNIFKLKGFDDAQPNAQLTGTVHFEVLDGRQYNEITSRYPGLVITYDSLSSVVKFLDTDKETVISEQTIPGKGNCENPINSDGSNTPRKESTAEFDFVWFGWSTTPDVELETAKITANDKQKYQVAPLKSVEGDKVYYPVFEAKRRQYKVYFINPTLPENRQILETVTVYYGSAAKYSGTTPRKEDTGSPDLYEFTNWYPSPEKITGELYCVAQFAVVDSKWYTLGINDIANGYTLNQSNQTITINQVNNKFNAAVKVPESFNLDSGTYTLVSLGGVGGSNSTLELVLLPNTLTEIQASCFSNCNSLFSIELPESLKKIGASAFFSSKIKEMVIPASVVSIGDAAFAHCRQLESLTVDEDNNNFAMINNCLVDINAGKLLQGFSNSTIPQDGSITSLGKYCFGYAEITSAVIPEGVTAIPENAFNRCEYLIEVTLPSTIKTLDATCFSWCPQLKTVNLPEGLVDIKTYVFNSCALEDVVIPSTIENVLSHAFGNNTTLNTVTFKKRIKEDGTIAIPTINVDAFKGSDNVEVRVPWAEDQATDNAWKTHVKNVVWNYEEA